MPICKHCGAQVRDIARFCPFCGEHLIVQTRQISAQEKPHVDSKGQNSTQSENPVMRNAIPETPKRVDRPPMHSIPLQSVNVSGNAGANTDIPRFAPPADEVVKRPHAPTFTPPPRRYDGPTCYHHEDEPATGQCARCGKYVCRDCVEAYSVVSGEYANKCLCYDCCKQLVEENVELLQQQKAKIRNTFILTVIGMIVGIVLSVGKNTPFILVLLAALWCGSFWVVVKAAWAGYQATDRFAGFIGGLISGLVIGPIKTIIKIVQCIKYLSSTSRFIEEDSAAIQQMDDYMEFTLVRNQNRGVDLDTLISQEGELYNNSYAQAVINNGEEAADKMLRQGATRIAENGEIIRNFAA